MSGNSLNATDSFAGHLSQGERILWEGRLGRGVILTFDDVMSFVIAPLWWGVALLFEYSLFRSGGPLASVIFGIPFGVYVLYIGAGRFFFDAWVRHGVFYAVTNQRILIVRSWPVRKFTAVPLELLSNMTVSANITGRRTIRFGPAASIFWREDLTWHMIPSIEALPQFIAVDNAQWLMDLIKKAAKSRC